MFRSLDGPAPFSRVAGLTQTNHCPTQQTSRALFLRELPYFPGGVGGPVSRVFPYPLSYPSFSIPSFFPGDGSLPVLLYHDGVRRQNGHSKSLMLKINLLHYLRYCRKMRESHRIWFLSSKNLCKFGHKLNKLEIKKWQKYANIQIYYIDRIRKCSNFFWFFSSKIFIELYSKIFIY